MTKIINRQIAKSDKTRQSFRNETFWTFLPKILSSKGSHACGIKTYSSFRRRDMLGQYSHTKKDKISSVVNIFFFFFYHIYSEKGEKG